MFLQELNWNIVYLVSNQYQTQVLVIALCRVPYDQYFPSFSYFTIYFTSLLTSEINEKYEKEEKYLPYCTRYAVR